VQGRPVGKLGGAAVERPALDVDTTVAGMLVNRATHGSRTSDSSVLQASMFTKARKVLAPKTIRCSSARCRPGWATGHHHHERDRPDTTPLGRGLARGAVPLWVETLLEVILMEQTAQTSICPDCHAMTDDLAAHEHWHSRLVRDIAVAVAKENERRSAAAAG
jgi:hypothetical protein